MSYIVQHLGFLDSLSCLLVTGPLVQILSGAFVPALNTQEPSSSASTSFLLLDPASASGKSALNQWETVPNEALAFCNGIPTVCQCALLS